jgi:hypothetical protein
MFLLCKFIAQGLHKLLRRSLTNLDRTGLTDTEVHQKIEEYLDKRNVKYQKDVAFRNGKKLNYVFRNDHGETVGIYILLWWRPVTYRQIFNLIDWSNNEEIDRLILVCRIMGERAREVINKEPSNVTYILESWFRRGSHNPLLAAF